MRLNPTSFNQPQASSPSLKPAGSPVSDDISYAAKVTSVYPSAVLGYPLQETVGPLAREYTGKTSTITNLLTNGGFETAGAGGADVWAFWSERVSDGALADETSVVYSDGGGHAAKITSGASKDTWVWRPQILVIPGETYTLRMYVRGDGTNSGRYAIYNNNDAGYITALTSVSVTSATYTLKEFTVVVPSTCNTIRVYLAGPNANGGIAYFDAVSLVPASTTAMKPHGTYAFSGVTYASPTNPPPIRNSTSQSLDGNNTYVLLGSPAFNEFWNGDKGSAIGWGCITSSAVWTDGVARYIFHQKSANDATYYLVFGKATTTNNSLTWRRRCGGETNEQLYTFTTPPTNKWFCMGFTWDVNVPRLKGYLYIPGVLPWFKVFDTAGSDAIAWGDHPVSDWNGVLFAGDTTAQEWIGQGCHVYYWKGITLNEQEMKYVMTP